MSKQVETTETSVKTIKENLVIKPTSDLFTASLWSAPKNEPVLRDFINATMADSRQAMIKEER